MSSGGKGDYDGNSRKISHRPSNPRPPDEFWPASQKTDKGIMMGGFRCLRILLLFAVVPLGGCLFRTRPVALRTSVAQLQTATGNDLIERINADAARINTLKATVGITASVGGSKRGKITQYQEIHGYILARKPSLLRMTGLFPILQNHLFDMVSRGQEFKLWIPAKNQFIVGNNDVASPSTHPLENLRPQVIYDALLFQSVDPQNELAVLEEGEHMVVDAGAQSPVLQPDYTLDIIKQNGQGWYLSRKTVFDRTDLQPHHQVLYDEHGSVVTDVLYDEYREFNGVLFPTNIKIRRPQEEFSIKLEVTKLTINEPITDDQFVLEPPSGAVLASR
jgi:outer membrane lipoprotein-sorting protein